MFTIDPSSHSRNRRLPHAFTIVELLITIAIIFILIGMALYGLSAARKAAARTQTMNALRQMMTGYSAYTEENKGKLMPGYIDPADFAAGRAFENLKVRLKTGYELQPGDKASYVWRLSPYLDHSWRTFMTDYRSSDLESRFGSEYGDGSMNGRYGPASASAGNTPPDLGIALRPSIGLNSIYLGGDSTHGDPLLAPWAAFPAANNAAVAAKQFSKVRTPSKIIVFAPVRAGDSETLKTNLRTGTTLGYPVLIPPYNKFTADTQTPDIPMWQFNPALAQQTPPLPDQIEFVGSMGSTSMIGVPFDRLDGHKISIGHLDGNVETILLESIGPSVMSPGTQMSRWSPFALGSN